MSRLHGPWDLNKQVCLTCGRTIIEIQAHQLPCVPPRHARRAPAPPDRSARAIALDDEDTDAADS